MRRVDIRDRPAECAALQDVAVASLAYARAAQRGAGIEVTFA